jgi:hypothetical protein
LETTDERIYFQRNLLRFSRSESVQNIERWMMMKGKTARSLFLAVCILLAILLLTRTIGPLMSGCTFALCLVVFGGLSRGFRKT